MSNEDIEDWEWEVVMEVILAAFIFDPIKIVVLSLYSCTVSVLTNRVPDELWVPFRLEKSYTILIATSYIC